VGLSLSLSHYLEICLKLFSSSLSPSPSTQIHALIKMSFTSLSSQFHQQFTYKFFVGTSFFQLRFGFVERFIRKTRADDVHEIDYSSQFHQQFTSSFCADIFAPKNKLQIQTVTRKKLRKTLSYVKGTRKMPMKLTPGVLESISSIFFGCVF